MEIYLESKYTQFGDLEDRFALRKELHCKNFQWFLENIYPESELLIGLHQMGKVGYLVTCIICRYICIC